MQSAASISSSVRTFFAPPEPLVSIFTVQPSFLAAFSSPSAAIYVCAIPVGHEVTASILAGLLAVSSSLSFMLALSSSASSITLRNSCGVLAALSAFVKSSSIRSTDSLLKTSRCTLSLVFGAAIRKRTSTGSPSSESKSTPSFIIIAASPGFVTASHFPCGIAIPSPTPVVLSSSLAITCLV